MKKIIKTLLVAMIIAMVVMVFAACQKDEPIVNPCANGHTMETFGEDLPTCTEDGLSAGVVCTVCGYAERTRFPIPAKGHKMADATCEDPSTCTVCGYTEGEALGHDMASVEALEPTCTTEGYNAHLGCTRCDYTEGKEVVEINPDAHTLVDVEALEPGCEDKPGYTAHKACECGYTEGYEVVTVEGHDFNEEELFYYPSAPTCTEGAYIAGYCTSCGEGFLLEEVPALGHADEDANGICDRCEAELHTHNLVDVVGKSATCTEAGYTAYKVCECGYTEGYETIEATGHTLADVEAKAAKCEEAGYTAHKACENCDYTEGKEDIEALGHVDENLDITCDHEGCTKRILPAGDTKISLFTAKHMVIVSLTNNYYVEGVVISVEDARNGKFVIGTFKHRMIHNNRNTH